MDEHEHVRADRLTAVTEAELRPASLVGSFFHSPREEGAWQGCVVAEPAPGTYLVELFSWLTGGSAEQRLVRLEDMAGWGFYDSAEWMRAEYERRISPAWERERQREAELSVERAATLAARSEEPAAP